MSSTLLVEKTYTKVDTINKERNGRVGFKGERKREFESGALALCCRLGRLLPTGGVPLLLPEIFVSKLKIGILTDF